MDPVEESTEDNAMSARLVAATPEERERLLREVVLDRASKILDRPELAEDSNFMENGLTSLDALELAKALMTLSGVEVPVVAVVDHPTATLLGKFLSEQIEEGRDAAE